MRKLNSLKAVYFKHAMTYILNLKMEGEVKQHSMEKKHMYYRKIATLLKYG